MNEFVLIDFKWSRWGGLVFDLFRIETDYWDRSFLYFSCVDGEINIDLFYIHFKIF